MAYTSRLVGGPGESIRARMFGPTMKLLARRIDPALVLESAADFVALAAEVEVHRPTWCWRVRGWGPNTSDVPGFCVTPHGLGDEEQDYVGRIGCDNAEDVEPPYIHYTAPESLIEFEGVANSAVATWIHLIEAPSYQVRIDAIVGPSWGSEVLLDNTVVEPFVDGASLRFSLFGDVAKGNSVLTWAFTQEFPVNFAQLLGAHCNKQAVDTPVDGSEDPEAPEQWVPWCRPNDGIVRVDLW